MWGGAAAARRRGAAEGRHGNRPAVAPGGVAGGGRRGDRPASGVGVRGEREKLGISWWGMKGVWGGVLVILGKTSRAGPVIGAKNWLFACEAHVASDCRSGLFTGGWSVRHNRIPDRLLDGIYSSIPDRQ